MSQSGKTVEEELAELEKEAEAVAHGAARAIEKRVNPDTKTAEEKAKAMLEEFSKKFSTLLITTPVLVAREIAEEFSTEIKRSSERINEFIDETKAANEANWATMIGDVSTVMRDMEAFIRKYDTELDRQAEHRKRASQTLDVLDRVLTNYT
jgi:hypothetical protein